MKTKLLVLCLLAIGTSHAKEINNNYIQTKQYYSQLISAPTPNTAELGLLMNMLPKGADLHHHYSGAIYAETYLEWVGRQKFCIYNEDNAALNAQKFHINTAPSEASSKICLSADATRQNNAFYRELLQKWSDKDFSNHSHDQPAPDQNFFNT
ncbi:MAG: adenosine deaminase, partial [Burkholderiales bacterium]|nr:adenosine deaminase [Burkholderiales bacterium]